MPNVPIQRLTDLMRHDSTGIYAACRRILIRHDVDPDRSFLLDHSPDEPDLETYWVLTDLGRLIQMDIQFLDHEELRVSGWTDETEHPENVPEDLRQAALEIAGEST